MRYVAAYLLAALGGKDSPSKGDVTKILESVGLDVEGERLDKVELLVLERCKIIDCFMFIFFVHDRFFLS